WVVTDLGGKYLYASDAIANKVYVVSIDPHSPTYQREVAEINVTPAPYGLRGLAITADGTRLYVAAPGNLHTAGSVAPGNVLVVNTDPTSGSFLQQLAGSTI